MGLRITSLHRYCVQATFLLMVACGGSPQRDVAAEADVSGQANYYVGKDDVYATLVSGSGGSWIFDEVTESNVPPANGYLVRLNDLAPAFDTRIAECTPQAYPTNHKCNPAHPFRNKNVGVLGKIISGGIAAGTAGKVTDVSRTYETAFDETTFNQAVDEALINSGLQQNRRDLLQALETYAMLIESSDETLGELRRSSEAEYRDTNSIQLDIEPKISGLTEYYSNDLNFRDLIELVPTSTGIFEGSSVHAKELLPCDARHCARKANTAITSVRAEIEQAKMGLRSNESYAYDVRCDKTSHAGYLLQMDCPNEVTRAPAGPVPLPLSLKILARDFDDLYPNLELRDDYLWVVINNGDISFTNLTSGYLSLTAQTVYYNSKIQTNATEISLAPGAVIKRSVDEFVSPAIDIESNYRQMTPDKANSSTFEFGFAVRYDRADATAETTLFEKREFNVGCVIGNRIRPGSCNQPTDEDMQANKIRPVPF